MSAVFTSRWKCSTILIIADRAGYTARHGAITRPWETRGQTGRFPGFRRRKIRKRPVLSLVFLVRSRLVKSQVR